MKLKIPNKAALIIDKLLDEGYEAGLVGGCLRNLLLGLPIKDYDVATSATTAVMRKLFCEYPLISIGENYGTLIIVVQGENIEITTFRKESGYNDFRHPSQLEFIVELKEDLKRRDFTINSLYYNDRIGLTDLFGGQIDLKNKIVKAIGNPDERFKEDPLRILRGIRFAATLGFTIEKNTKAAMLSNKELLSRISPERIAVEFTLILQNDSIAELLQEYEPIFLYLIPELNSIDYDKVDRMQGVFLKLAAFLLDLKDKSVALLILRKLKLTVSHDLRRSDLKQIAELISLYDGFHETDTESLIELYKNLDWNRKQFDRMLALKEFQPKTPLIETSFEELAVSGHDLASEGISGSNIGSALDKLFTGVLRGDIPNEKESLLKFLHK